MQLSLKNYQNEVTSEISQSLEGHGRFPASYKSIIDAC